MLEVLIFNQSTNSLNVSYNSERSWFLQIIILQSVPKTGCSSEMAICRISEIFDIQECMPKMHVYYSTENLMLKIVPLYSNHGVNKKAVWIFGFSSKSF